MQLFDGLNVEELESVNIEEMAIFLWSSVNDEEIWIGESNIPEECISTQDFNVYVAEEMEL